MKDYTKPLDKNHYNEAFQYIRKMTGRNTRKEKIRNIMTPIGCIVFWAASLVTALGVFFRFADEEEKALAAHLSFAETIWNRVSELIANLFNKLPFELPVDIPVKLDAPLHLVAMYIVSFVITGVIALVLLMVCRGKGIEEPAGTEKEKAKGLYELACGIPDVRQEEMRSSAAKISSIVFVLAVVCGLLYGGFKLGIFTTKVKTLISMSVGMTVFGIALYFIYKLLIWIFLWMIGIFYAGGRLRSAIVSDTETYWLSLDPEEVQRRDAEAAAYRKCTSDTPKAPSASGINKYDSFTWTYGYVRDNETICSDVLLSSLQNVKKNLQAKNYSIAANEMKMVVHGLELLTCIDEECKAYYISPFYANCYGLSRVYAFGLHNAQMAEKYLEKACQAAQEAASYPNISGAAERDYGVMSEILGDFKRGRSLRAIEEEFFQNFPYDIIEKI